MGALQYFRNPPDVPRSFRTASHDRHHHRGSCGVIELS